VVNWQLTATTIYCDAVDDEVTLMVHGDWSVKCTGYRKYSEPSKVVRNLLKRKSKQLKRQLECVGQECYRVIQYKEKLLAEEVKKGFSQQAVSEKTMPPEEGGG
jgi:hypothetical protein